MDKLYEEYGKLMVQAEILNARIRDVKDKIGKGLSNPVKKEEVKEEEPKEE